MPVETTLMHNNRVLWVTYSGTVSAQDVQYAIQQYVVACQKSSQLVHSINDARQMIGVPASAMPSTQSPTTPLNQPNKGKTIVITTSETLRATLQSAMRLRPGSQYLFAKTPDEAWAIMGRVLADENITSEE